jgi:cytochrome c oxidase subunit 2
MSELLPVVPVMASTLAYKFEALFWYITIVTGLSAVLVYGAMLYFCVAYRRTATSGSTPRILGSARLEIAWTLIPTIIFFTFFGWGLVVYTYAVHPPKDAMEVFIIGKQWMWKAQYPQNGQRVIIGGNPRNMSEVDRKSIGRLVIPVDRPVRFTMTSEDVIHSFGIPAFRIKMDVLPGRYTTQWHHPTEIGEYHVTCNQYCGTWHSLMVGKVAVVSQADFDQWLLGAKPLQGSQNPVDGSLASEGRQLFLKLQCIKCHTGKPDARAPILENLYGSRVPLRGGGGEIADEAYILESILKPRAKVVEGWEPIMPSYQGQVTAEDQAALVEFIRSLRRGTTPDQTEYTQPPVGAPTERSEPKTPTSPEKK